MLSGGFREWVRRFFAFSVPGQCALCHAWPAQPVCDACVARFAQPQHRCLRCALPLVAGIAECGHCIANPSALDACHAAVSYGYPWSALIAQFKFAGEASWARTFATLMQSAPWVEPAIDAADFVVPMPLSRERLAERGFNQAWLLARALSPASARAGLLVRTTHTPAQASLDLRQRHVNVKNAFAVEPSKARELRGRRLLLVDDVMTSGASLAAAARVLREAGAAHVGAVVFARTGAPA